jgi:hypothetical protein
VSVGRTWIAIAIFCAAPWNAAAQIGPAETAFEAFRSLDDRLGIAISRGDDPEGASVRTLRRSRDAARQELSRRLATVDRRTLSGQDGAAYELMARALEDAEADSKEEGGHDAASCDGPGPEGDAGALGAWMYRCFGTAAQSIRFEGETLDRLTVLDLLSRTEDRARRKQLFLSLANVWKSVNGDGSQQSPYRRLVRSRVAEWSTPGARAVSPFVSKPPEFGLDLATVEQWLRAVLLRWRETTPDERLEPWDYSFTWGKANRDLDRSIPRRRLRKLNDSFYRALGAPPRSLGIRYDLTPRTGKDPVAFTTFGARPRLDRGRWTRGEFWVFATYRVGGLGNLSELLHETGHGIHLAAIRTRPALADWPDSDTFTEALADMPALEVYEPSWQERYLGRSAPLEECLRAKYSSVVLDIAWALFEIEMHRDPGADPNRIWTAITHEYLRIEPHPELSWWAIRGQLIDAPGYMLNYALGSLIAADLRARTREIQGGRSFSEADRSWYPLLSERIYRFGLERPSREVLEAYLGRPLSPHALLEDMARAKGVKS